MTPTPEYSYEAHLYPVTTYTRGFTGALVPIPGLHLLTPLGTVETMTVTADAGWSPRFQATVQVADWHPALVDNMAYVRVLMRRLPGVPIALADWTGAFGTLSLAEWPSSPATITTILGGTIPDPSLPVSDRTPQSLDLVLAVRDIALDLEARTATLDLSSLEMDLQEIGNFTKNIIYAGADWLVRDLVLDVLRRSGFTAARLVSFDLSPFDTVGFRNPTNELDERLDGWQLGESAYEFLSRVLVPFAADLWAENTTDWHLTVDSIQRWRPGRDATPYVRATKITPHIRPLRDTSYVVVRHASGTTPGENPMPWDTYEHVGPLVVGRGTWLDDGTLEKATPGPGWYPRDYLYEVGYSGNDVFRQGAAEAQADIDAPADFTIRPDWRCDIDVVIGENIYGDEDHFTLGQWNYNDTEPTLSELDSNPSTLHRVVWTFPEGTMQLEAHGLGYPVTANSSPFILVP